MANKSRLHIPRPTARPGDKPDFSYLDLSPAGSVDKPSIDARVAGVAVAVVLLRLRAPFLVVVLAAAATAAVLRALGWG